MIKERLKEMDFRITELSDYLQVSRPTLYKFIECYDKKQFKVIDNKALKLFNFIEENKLVGKRGVISFILNNLTDNTDSVNTENTVIKYIQENPQSKKSIFISKCAQSELLDDVIYYLLDVCDLLDKGNLTLEEKQLLAPYNALVEKLNKH